MPRYLTTEEAALHLSNRGVARSPKTLERWRCVGIGPRYYRIMGRIRYTAEDLDQWLEIVGQVVLTADTVDTTPRNSRRTA